MTGPKLCWDWITHMLARMMQVLLVAVVQMLVRLSCETDMNLVLSFSEQCYSWSHSSWHIGNWFKYTIRFDFVQPALLWRVIKDLAFNIPPCCLHLQKFTAFNETAAIQIIISKLVFSTKLTWSRRSFDSDDTMPSTHWCHHRFDLCLKYYLTIFHHIQWLVSLYRYGYRPILLLASNRHEQI